MIPVTKPFLPPKAEYQQLVDEVWERNWLTNNGPLVNDLEIRLKEYLGLNHLIFVTNGTMALQIAIKSLDIKGEVITTPFSYVATTSSIVWENCMPVYVDIDKKSLNIDPTKIESKITKDTQAILATHVFGNPCDVDEIERIAKRNNLHTIYDGAHAFGVKYKNKCVFNYGDISTSSFHATKLFHTVEGGAVYVKDAQLIKKLSWLRNFGHDGQEDFYGCGINGKNSEMHAAMGLCNLNYIDQIITRRKYLSHYYKSKLENLRYSTPEINPFCEYNYAYLPVILESEEVLLKMVNVLNNHLIFPRRYFYPSLNSLNYVEQVQMPVSESISKRILCLPLYHTLKESEIDLIVRLLLRTQNY